MPRIPSDRATIQMRKTVSCTGLVTIVCPPFGQSCICMGTSLSDLRVSMTLLESILPGSSDLMSKNRPTFSDCKRLFNATSNEGLATQALNKELYYTFTSQISFLGQCIDVLKEARKPRSKILRHLQCHAAISSSALIRIVANNLNKLLEVALSIQRTTQFKFGRMLDAHPDASREKLASFLNSSRMCSDKITKFVSWKHFASLGIPGCLKI
ncbi:hypothetical protein BT96DRAFT_1008684 [Gymnopus androsaceus JB14]|uniref:Uncharacterized protein n=1 Tax=Gymnopus androsaceus JB14 TaxID=1447944 RepID=A0A6A4GEF4_9AGAR|nr:hypothetical protein BT96DRAFT_1008684 [Gymnopus androsaceus JB14]